MCSSLLRPTYHTCTNAGSPTPCKMHKQESTAEDASGVLMVNVVGQEAARLAFKSPVIAEMIPLVPKLTVGEDDSTRCSQRPRTGGASEVVAEQEPEQ